MSIFLDECAPGTIKPRLNDWRTHSDHQIELLMESLRTSSVPQAPLVDSENRIVCGWGTVQAAVKLGLNTIQISRVDHMTDDELRLYAIKANRLADLAGYDEELLNAELRDLEFILDNPNFNHLGFEAGELTRILKLHEAELATIAGEDEAPEPDPPITGMGDIWLVGPHRIACSDALQSVSYDALMAGEKASFVFSDVPYNLDADTIGNGGRFQHESFENGGGEFSPVEFTRFLTKAMRHMAAHSVDGALVALFMSYHFLLELLRAGVIVFDRPKAMCTWVKGQGGQGSLYRGQTEHIVFFKNGAGPYRNNVQLGRFGRNRTTAWQI